MEKYYCKFCNKNIGIRTGEFLRCPECGYLPISAKLEQKEIIKRKIERTAYCAHCDKMVLSIPTKTLIDALNQRSAREIKNLKTNNVKRDGVELNEKEKQQTIYNISIKLKSALKYLYCIEKTYQKVCSQCYKEIKFNSSTPSFSFEFKCPFCNKQIDNDSTFCKYCGAKINGKTRHIPKDIKKKVWDRDKGRCATCGSNEDLQFDHIIPYSKGGANTVENLQILCSRCNKKKFNKINA
jgi:hypothetical protein